MYKLGTHQKIAVEQGYRFECPCGEYSRTIDNARSCRKCLKYSIVPGRYVIDISTGAVVFGTVPDEEEHAAILKAWRLENDPKRANTFPHYQIKA